MLFDYTISGELGFNKVEFNFITQYMNNKIDQESWKADALNRFIENVAGIRKAIQAYHLTKFSTYSESAYSGLAIQKINEFIGFNYAYQRYDLKLIHKDWLKNIYNIQNNNFTDTGLLVGSGMSALLVSFLSLKNLWPSYTQIDISQDGYFEINDLLDNCPYLFKKNFFEEGMPTRADIMLLDSSVTTLPQGTFLLEAKAIIVDTTCWEPGNSVLRDLIIFLENFSGIIILIRSHIKLDCFGLETGRLGSIVILSSKKCERTNSIDMAAIQNKFQGINGNTGANFILSNHYPWLTHKAFFSLCSARTNTIRHYTSLISETLTRHVSDFEIIKPQHGLFLLAKFLKNKPHDPIEFEKRLVEICALGNKVGVAITPAPSFALCYTSLRGFKNNIDQEVYLRIAPSPNMHLRHVKRVARFFKKLLTNQNFYRAKDRRSFIDV